MKQTIAQFIAQSLGAQSYCMDKEHWDAYAQHEDRILKVMKETAPSGSGFDAGTKLCSFKSQGGTVVKLVFETSFHHMDEHGYDGWTEHQVIVTPSFGGLDIRVTGKDRNHIKMHIGETFHHWLGSEAPEIPWIK